jgi:DNA-nicking Smr family endonuclease
MIIHGKGIHTSGTDPVLGKLVRSFIERDKRCGASGHPKNKAEGGTGATWVILK